MHIEFLVEDKSGGIAMDYLASKLLRANITFRIHPYKGIGHIPSNLRPKTNADKRILLDQLPRLLRGYGKAGNPWHIVVVCDLDDKDKQRFLAELTGILDTCDPKPNTCFCLAVEELEAWYLGDLGAVRKAYPRAKESILNQYINDSICGTWEMLADAVCKGGHKELIKKGWQAIGEQKSIWARKISPYMDVDKNKSPSFIEMRTQLNDIAQLSERHT